MHYFGGAQLLLDTQRTKPPTRKDIIIIIIIALHCRRLISSIATQSYTQHRTPRKHLNHFGQFFFTFAYYLCTRNSHILCPHAQRIFVIYKRTNKTPQIPRRRQPCPDENATKCTVRTFFRQPSSHEIYFILYSLGFQVTVAAAAAALLSREIFAMFFLVAPTHRFYVSRGDRRKTRGGVIGLRVICLQCCVCVLDRSALIKWCPRNGHSNFLENQQNISIIWTTNHVNYSIQNICLYVCEPPLWDVGVFKPEHANRTKQPIPAEYGISLQYCHIFLDCPEWFAPDIHSSGLIVDL